MDEWRSVLGQDPGNIEARLGLARGAAKAGDRAVAAQEYFRILQRVADQPEARRELARGVTGVKSARVPKSAGARP